MRNEAHDPEVRDVGCAEALDAAAMMMRAPLESLRWSRALGGVEEAKRQSRNRGGANGSDTKTAEEHRTGLGMHSLNTEHKGTLYSLQIRNLEEVLHCTVLYCTVLY